MRKTIKILTIILLAIFMISFATTNVFANDEDTDGRLTPSEIKPTYTPGSTTELQSTAGRIMGMIRNVATIASVIIIMILGVKYMLGSVEEKAEYKKSFMPLIIGIILVVAASNIAAFIFDTIE